MHDSSGRVAERVVLGGICLLCGFMTVTAYGYSLRDTLGPGAGFFPFWLGMLGMVMCMALLVRSWRGGAIGEGAQALLPRGEGGRRAAALLGGLVVAALLLQPLGFRLSMLIFTTGLLLALGVRRPVTIAVFALLSSFGLFHVFYYWLKVPLPTGMFGF
jgi:putative tricarboxylic transport membrane protein